MPTGEFVDGSRARGVLPDPTRQPTDFLRELYLKAVYKVRGDVLLEESSSWDGRVWSYERDGRKSRFEIPVDGRIVVVGAGKAAAPLAGGIESKLGNRIDGGCVVVKYGHTEPLQRIMQVEAGHPIPDENSVRGTREVIRKLDGLRPQDRVFVLLTGGASSLLVQPIAGVTLEDKARITALLLRSAATINEINVVRKALSGVKGGKLLRHIRPASAVTLVISDVPDGDVGTIGSGPTIESHCKEQQPAEILEKYGLVENIPASVISRLREQKAAEESDIEPTGPGTHKILLLADSATLVKQVRQSAERANLEMRIVDANMHGNTHIAAEKFAAAVVSASREKRDAPVLLVAAGETTLKVAGHGSGGRNQEFALVVAEHIAGVSGVHVLAVGTDGTDGPTPAAGAFADGTTLSRAREAGLDVGSLKADNDSYRLFQSLGDLLVTGPSGTNVMDLVLGLVLPRGRDAGAASGE